MTRLELFGYFLTGLTLISVGVWATVFFVVARDILRRRNA